MNNWRYRDEENRKKLAQDEKIRKKLARMRARILIPLLVIAFGLVVLMEVIRFHFIVKFW